LHPAIMKMTAANVKRLKITFEVFIEMGFGE
jgi:hypothetical protein